MAATIALVIALVIFIAGAVAGVLILVSWGIRREERDFTLTRQAPGQLTQGTRRVTGLWVRQRSDIDPIVSSHPAPDRHSMLV
jgi:heme/copper-type cytochrome/quinol oxidase subunit 2